jgi:hypothetical protein
LKTRSRLISSIFGKYRIDFRNLFTVILREAASSCKRKKMKKRFLVALLLISCYSFSQPVVKPYGYARYWTIGTALERDTSTPEVSRPSASVEYFFYVSASSTSGIQPVEIWLHGQRYTISRTTLIKSPVMSSGGTELIPKTKMAIRQLKWNEKAMPLKTTPSWLKKMMDENELIIVYFWKGKKYYKPLKKILELENTSGV